MTFHEERKRRKKPWILERGQNSELGRLYPVVKC